MTRPLAGVIAPYKAQIELLRSLRFENEGVALEFGTVDSFQGREKDVVLLSCVRASDRLFLHTRRLRARGE